MPLVIYKAIRLFSSSKELLPVPLSKIKAETRIIRTSIRNEVRLIFNLSLIVISSSISVI